MKHPGCNMAVIAKSFHYNELTTGDEWPCMQIQIFMQLLNFFCPPDINQAKTPFHNG